MDALNFEGLNSETNQQFDKRKWLTKLRGGGGAMHAAGQSF